MVKQWFNLTILTEILRLSKFLKIPYYSKNVAYTTKFMKQYENGIENVPRLWDVKNDPLNILWKTLSETVLKICARLILCVL